MSSSPVSPSPIPFAMSSVAPSTASSSPPPQTELDSEYDRLSEESTHIEEEDFEIRYKRLNFLLEKSAAYASILQAQMDKKKLELYQTPHSDASRPKQAHRWRQRSESHGKRRRVDESESSGDDSDGGSPKRMKLQPGDFSSGASKATGLRLQQPALVTGGKLKDYQLEGVEWMISLDQNGISGILADEMGLGKTLQIIAFNAYLRERKNFRPFLVVCPLSVLNNWVEEFAKFAPAIPVCMYHGTPTERAVLRRTLMRLPGEVPSDKVVLSKAQFKKETPRKSHGSGNTTGRLNLRGPRARRRKTKSRRLSKGEKEDEIETSDENFEDQSEHDSFSQTGEFTPDPEELDAASFPVVITTYEIIIKDRVYLSTYNFSYIVVDEGHRLKNLNCKLIQEIKKYKSAGRMILTGTPLHNNLAELWSLLNFILPDIFNDVDAFQQWFNLPTMQQNLSSSHSSQIIHSLHAILKPFLLRRLKADVEVNLPPKKEYVLYAPLSERQRELYDRTLGGSLREFLTGRDQQSRTEDKDIDGDAPRRLRSEGGAKKKKIYTDRDDEEFFNQLEPRQEGQMMGEELTSIAEIGREHHYKATVKQVNNMRLQNVIMQLRKVCSHPFLFDWPLDPHTRLPILNEELVHASGKMMVLDRLLSELIKRGHKVLLFSQFTTMLDIVEDWASEFKGWKICRIDGSTPPLERTEQMYRFQNGGDAPDAPPLFLLSTRSGGLGVNLVAADTVIFYDQDWNPQMDAQAQDRAHRIGQTKPVLIFRLVTAHTIETEIMQRATEKRKLEALVIAKGKFKRPASAEGRGKPETLAELAASLLKLEAEKIEVVPNTEAGKASVLSDEDLEMLLDRRPEVFADRGQGWTSASFAAEGGRKNVIVAGKKTAFAVYGTPVDEGNAALANMLGEDMI